MKESLRGSKVDFGIDWIPGCPIRHFHARVWRLTRAKVELVRTPLTSRKLLGYRRAYLAMLTPAGSSISSANTTLRTGPLPTRTSPSHR